MTLARDPYDSPSERRADARAAARPRKGKPLTLEQMRAKSGPQIVQVRADSKFGRYPYGRSYAYTWDGPELSEGDRVRIPVATGPRAGGERLATVVGFGRAGYVGPLKAILGRSDTTPTGNIGEWGDPAVNEHGDFDATGTAMGRD